MMRRRAKHIREGQARERKKEGKPAHFGAHVKRTRFRKTRLVKSEKATGRYRKEKTPLVVTTQPSRADLATPP